MRKIKTPERILIVRTDRIGDVILSTPVIENLRQAFPHAYLAFMCSPSTYPVLKGNPYLDEVIIYDKKGKDKGIIPFLLFSFRLWKKKFDWAIILHPTNRVHILTFLAGIPFRIGWRKKLGFFLTKSLAHRKQEGEKHELEYTLDILKELNIPIVSKTTYFPVSKEDDVFVEKLLYEKNIQKGDLVVVIHPSASCCSKRWPVSHFLLLVRMLIGRLSAKVIVVSSADEAMYGEDIVKKEKKIIDLRGKLNLSQLGALLKKAHLLISNDSGPVHIAASLGTPVISIFGRNQKGLSPTRWRPLGEETFYIHKDVGCKNCLAHNCQNKFLCLWRIKPQEVFALAESILEKKYFKKVCR